MFAFLYLHSAAVALLAFFLEAVPTDGRSLDPHVVGFVEQAAGAAGCQVSFIVAAAAAAERPRDVPAAKRQISCISRAFTAHSGKYIHPFDLFLELDQSLDQFNEISGPRGSGSEP